LKTSVLLAPATCLLTKCIVFLPLGSTDNQSEKRKFKYDVQSRAEMFT